MDTTERTDRESIIGVFETLERAKHALADHVLDETVDRIEPCYVGIYEVEVEE